MGAPKERTAIRGFGFVSSQQLCTAKYTLIRCRERAKTSAFCWRPAIFTWWNEVLEQIRSQLFSNSGDLHTVVVHEKSDKCNAPAVKTVSMGLHQVKFITSQQSQPIFSTEKRQKLGYRQQSTKLQITASITVIQLHIWGAEECTPKIFDICLPGSRIAVISHQKRTWNHQEGFGRQYIVLGRKQWWRDEGTF